MSSPYDERAAALAIACPNCGANPTMTCVDDGLATCPVHTDRLDELHDLVMKGLAGYRAEDMQP